MTDEKKLWGRPEWKAVVLGLAGVVLGFVLVHLWNDHQDLHRLFDLVSRSQRQPQAPSTAPPQEAK